MDSPLISSLTIPNLPQQNQNTSPAILLLYECVKMEIRRTMTMNWEGLGDLDDDDDLFFDAQRLSAVVPQDLGSSSSDEEFDDSRMSFSSATDFPDFQTSEYDLWMAAPESIADRRRRLLRDMGLGSSKNMSAFAGSNGASLTDILSVKTDISPLANVGKPVEKDLSPVSVKLLKQDVKLPCEPVFSGSHGLLLRSRSHGSIDTSSMDLNRRKEEMIGSISKQHLTRTFSSFSTPLVGLSSPSKVQQRGIFVAKDDTSKNEENDDTKPISLEESILLIKNLDNGKEFMVQECNKEESWNKLSDVKTGEQITMAEFERSAGYSRKVKELMKKAVNECGNDSDDQNLTPGNSSFHNSFKKSKKKGAALFKNIKIGSIGGSKSDKEKTSTITSSPSVNSNNPRSSSQWVKARVYGKPYKEFTALHMSQEIQGHDGSIWAMKFTNDGQYLASAGEDKVIHIWEVLEFDVMAMWNGDDLSSAGGTPVHAMAMVASPDGRPPLPDATLEKKKKGKKKKGVPDYVHVPETIFGLSETPVCTLEGHVDDVLDLSWSRSRLLLSSSMDKTVRLWDIETKNCLKIFSHTDYDNDYFISGSLDAKVRIWNIPDRHVVDWIDLHEMITAVGYSNDGKVSVVGSNKGICRFYNTAGYKNNYSQLSADYSPDGKYIISASEDSHVYIWRHEEAKGKHKYPIITSYEHFPCKEVSVTAPWPGGRKLEQPLVAMHSKKHSKRFTTTLLPPVTNSSSIHDDIGHSKPLSTPLPPLPKRSNPSTDSVEDINDHAHSDSSVGPCESFSSVISSSGRFDEMTSPSPNSMSSPPGWGGNRSHKTIQATAWGLVIVTAGLGGEIKVFQNVGLPFKVGRL
ncbi:putative transcription factor WD40-like family [Helianthus annuus]|nr:putative transcription factor WD40-like family [Helianthus annuus]KAJ0762854.1 putative transcription factor WD40-like family [Helianthus annuus]